MFDISRTKRRRPGCIGCEQTAAKRDGRPKSASTNTGLSDVGIPYDQSSRWQKLAAVPEEIFERQVQDKTHMPTTAGLIRAAAEPNGRWRMMSLPARVQSITKTLQPDRRDRATISGLRW